MNKKCIFLFGLGILFLIGMSLWSLLVGSYQIQFDNFFEDNTSSLVFWQIRLPRMLTAIAAGAGLSVVGLVLQTFFRNPLADASVLGIVQGSSLGVAVVLLGFYEKSFSGIAGELLEFTGWLVLPAAAGAWLIMLLLSIVALKMKNISYLLITGLMIGSLTTAIIAIWQYQSKPEQLQSLLFWSLGNLSGTTFANAVLLLVVNTIGIGWVLSNYTSFDKLSLGEKYAQQLGVNLRTLKMKIIFVCGMMVGSITAFCGPISFIGIAVPFMVRNTIKTALFFPTAIGTILVGSGVLLLADNVLKIFSQNGYFYPLNALLTLLGAPIVIQILFQYKT